MESDLIQGSVFSHEGQTAKLANGGVATTKLLGPENQEGALVALVLPCQALPDSHTSLNPDSHRVGACQDALAELTLPEGHTAAVVRGPEEGGLKVA